MSTNGVLSDEASRLARLRSLELLDTEAEPVIDAFTQMAATATGQPRAAVCLVDAHRVWVKSGVGWKHGLEVPREASFSGLAIEQDGLFEVEDARGDPRFQAHPFTGGEWPVVHYAGVPLVLGEGLRVGALCVTSNAPGRLSPEQRSQIEAMAHGVVEVLKLREQEHQARHAVELGTPRLLAEVAPVGMFSCTLDGRLVFANDALVRLLGATASEAAQGRAWTHWFHPDDRSWIHTRWLRAVEAGEEYAGTGRLERDGAVAWLKFRLTPAGGDGPSTGYIGAVADITETLTLQQQVHTAGEQLRGAARSAQEDQAARSRFLATVGHEMRTPIHGVLGLSKLLMGLEMQAEHRSYVKIIDSCASNLLELVNDVLDFSQLEAGRLRIERHPARLNDLVQEQAKRAQDAAQEKALGFDAYVAESLPPWVMMDAHRVRQVLANLLSNALKFTAEGSVALRVERVGAAGEILRFQVADTGIGMTAEEQATLFTRYSRSADDDGHGETLASSGLGLAISLRLAGMMGGTLAVQSTPGAGSTFTFDMPLLQAAEPARLHQPPRPAKPQRTGAILVVDDNEVNRVVADGLLRALGHEDVTLANDGIAALAACSRREYDLILMDCLMPGMDGLEATRQLRARGCHCPVVAVTASASRENADLYTSAGMDDYLAKPLTRNELVACLDTWLDRTHIPAERV